MLGGTWSVAVGACRVRHEVCTDRLTTRYSGFLDDLVAQREDEFSGAYEAVFGCRDDVLTGDVSGLSGNKRGHVGEQMV